MLLFARRRHAAADKERTTPERRRRRRDLLVAADSRLRRARARRPTRRRQRLEAGAVAAAAAVAGESPVNAPRPPRSRGGSLGRLTIRLERTSGRSRSRRAPSPSRRECHCELVERRSAWRTTIVAGEPRSRCHHRRESGRLDDRELRRTRRSKGGGRGGGRVGCRRRRASARLELEADGVPLKVPSHRRPLAPSFTSAGEARGGGSSFAALSRETLRGGWRCRARRAPEPLQAAARWCSSARAAATSPPPPTSARRSARFASRRRRRKIRRRGQLPLLTSCAVRGSRWGDDVEVADVVRAVCARSTRRRRRLRKARRRRLGVGALPHACACVVDGSAGADGVCARRPPCARVCDADVRPRVSRVRARAGGRAPRVWPHLEQRGMADLEGRSSGRSGARLRLGGGGLRCARRVSRDLDDRSDARRRQAPSTSTARYCASSAPADRRWRRASGASISAATRRRRRCP